MTHEKLTAADRFERHGANHWRATITGRVLPRLAGGAPVATAPKALEGKLAEVESDIDRLKGERHEAHQRFTKARAEFAAQPGYDTKGEHYRRAETASAAVAAVDEKIAGAKSAQVAILRDLSGQQAHKGADPDTVDTAQRGGWLAKAIRTKALTTGEIGSTTDLDQPFFDRLAEQSALMASGPTFVDIQTSSIRIPRLSGRLAPAPAVAELAPIPEVNAPLDQIEVEPPKFARLASLSTEAAADARPVVLAAHELELVRSVAAGFDLAAFKGAVGSAQVGLANTTGIAVVALDPLAPIANLDPFARALGALRASATRATAIYMHPAVWEGLSKIKKGSSSNEPLVSGELSATDQPAESILGVPVYQTDVLATNEAFVADASGLVVVRRSLVQVDVDPFYQFNTGGVGVRVIARLALAVPQPAAAAHITGIAFA
jgi:HK97 family phage major capsid protein